MPTDATLHAFVIESAAAGSKKNVVQLIDHLIRLNARVTLFYSGGRADARFLEEELPRFLNAGVECHRIPAGNRVDGRILRSVLRVFTILRGQDCRRIVLHGHSSIGGVIARLAGLALRSRGRRVKVIYTPHAPITLNRDLTAAKRWVYAHAERVLALVTDVVVAVSAEEGRHLATLGISTRKIITVLNGIAVPDAVPLRVLADERRLLFVGRLDEQKDPLCAVTYAAQVESSVLDVVGDGPQRSEVMAAAAALGERYRVVVWGYRGDVPDFYGRADCVLISSRYEGLPYTALEAVAHGCLVVARPCAGIDELIEQGVVYDWNAVDLNVLDDRTFQALKVSAFQALRAHYDERRMLGAYEAIYDQ